MLGSLYIKPHKSYNIGTVHAWVLTCMFVAAPPLWAAVGTLRHRNRRAYGGPAAAPRAHPNSDSPAAARRVHKELAWEGMLIAARRLQQLLDRE